MFTHEQVGENEIAAVQQVFGVKFPKDYIECAKMNHGGHPDLEIYNFDGHEEAVFNSLLSYKPSESNYILGVYSNVRDRLVNDVYPFADDPFGNLICFDYRHGKDKPPIIVFWDHELASEDPKKGLSPICKSFTELLSKLHTE